MRDLGSLTRYTVGVPGSGTDDEKTLEMRWAVWDHIAAALDTNGWTKYDLSDDGYKDAIWVSSEGVAVELWSYSDSENGEIHLDRVTWTGSSYGTPPVNPDPGSPVFFASTYGQVKVWIRINPFEVAAIIVQTGLDVGDDNGWMLVAGDIIRSPTDKPAFAANFFGGWQVDAAFLWDRSGTAYAHPAGTAPFFWQANPIPSIRDDIGDNPKGCELYLEQYGESPADRGTMQHLAMWSPRVDVELVDGQRVHDTQYGTDWLVFPSLKIRGEPTDDYEGSGGPWMLALRYAEGELGGIDTSDSGPFYFSGEWLGEFDDGGPIDPPEELTIRRALRRNNLPLIGVITLKPSEDESFSFVTGQRSLFGFPPIASNVASFGSTLDEFSRETSLGSLSVTFLDDGFLKQLARTRNFKRKQITLRVGTADLPLDEFSLRFDGIIDSIRSANGAVFIEAIDWLSTLLDVAVHHDYMSLHPVQHAKQVLINAGLPSARYDAASFVPDDRTAQFNMSRSTVPKDVEPFFTVEQTINGKERAGDILKDIVALSAGAFVDCTSAGKLVWRPYDPLAVPAIRFGRNDYERCTQIESSGICNRFSINFLRNDLRGHKTTVQANRSYEDRNSVVASNKKNAWDPKPQDPTLCFTANNTAAQTSLAHPDGSANIVHSSLSTEWIMAEYLAASPTEASGGFDISIAHASMVGFSGARTDGLSLDLLAPATEACPVFLGIGFEGDEDEEFELVRADESELPALVDSVPVLSGYFPSGVKYTVTTRGLFGTDAINHHDEHVLSRVWDYTIPVYVAQDKVDRFGYGPPKVQLIVHPSFMLDVRKGLPIGIDDFTDVIHSQPDIGEPSDWVWEIVNVQEILFEDSPRIEVIASWMRSTYGD